MTQSYFRLFSPAFDDNGIMDVRFAGRNPKNPNCVGENVSPPLQWSNIPAETRSLALTMYDLEGRNGLGVSHWVAYGIPAEMNGLSEGASAHTDAGFINGLNILREPIYYGPCPPKATGHHHYVFTLIASRLGSDELPPGLDREALLEKIGSSAIAATGLIGRFGH